MKVVLKKTGEVKEVSDGYARNYLIPQGLAVVANKQNVAEAKDLQKKNTQNIEKQLASWEQAAASLKDKTIEIKSKANDDGTLFGAVAESAIIDAAKSAGIALEEDWLKLGEHIKKTGDHTVAVEFPGGRKADLKLNIKAA